MKPEIESILKESRKALSAKEIGECLGKSRQAVEKQAKKEAWPVVRDGKAKLFLISGLPKDVRTAIAAAECPITPPPITPIHEASLAALPGLKGKAKERVEYIVPIASYFQSFWARSGLRITPAAEEFVVRWNAGEIEAEPWLREMKPRINKNSLLDWSKGIKEKGVIAVGGSYGAHRKGTGVIDSNPEMRETILGMLYKHPHVSCQLIRERLESIFIKRGEKIPSLGRLHAWVRAWKKENRNIWEYVKAPDSYRSRFLASTGSAYELIIRQNQRWEYDATPSDLLLDNGKRYAIVGVINIFDRRLKLDVVERSTAHAVANLTRRALLDWGIPESAVTDNGKDFVASYLQQVFADLGIFHDILPPFRPDLKPGIERAFRSFSHHIITLLPCYVGHNVAARQQIRERETFAKRLMSGRKKDEKPEELSMAVTPEKLQQICDEWCENVYAHRPHSGLKGRTPFEVSRSWITPVGRVEDLRALDILLTPLASRKGWRTVGKKGVRCHEGTFVAEELGGMIGSRVQVRINHADPGYAYIFSEDGDFIAKAANIDAMESTERKTLSDATSRAGHSAAKAGGRELRDMAKRTDADKSAEQIMEYHAERAEKIRQAAGPAQHRSVSHTTPELQAATDAANAHVPAVAMTEQAREIVPGFTPPPTAQERYKLLVALQAREDLNETESRWVRLYRASNEAVAFREMYQMFAVNG